MAKTKMTHTTRNSIRAWMYEQYDVRHKDVLKKPLEKVIAVINKLIDAKYPLTDMMVLEKYKLTRVDNCLQFINSETSQIFGLDFRIRTGYTEKNYPEVEIGALHKVPAHGGCRSNTMYQVTNTQQKVIEDYVKAVNEAKAARHKKFVEYGGFLLACNTVDEFNDVVPLPDELKQRYLTGGALIVVNPEIIADIRKDFTRRKTA